MRKLTDKTKYKYTEDNGAVVYACLKGTTKFVPAFICHASCIPLIINANSFNVDGVILKPYKKS